MRKAVKAADEDTRDAINIYDFVDVRYHKYLDESKNIKVLSTQNHKHHAATLFMMETFEGK